MAEGRYKGPCLRCGALALPAQILHCNESLAVLFADIMNGNDIWMIQRSRSLSFEVKSCKRSGDTFRKEFQGNETMQADILSPVHHTHSAQLLDDAVVGDSLADGGFWLGHVAAF